MADPSRIEELRRRVQQDPASLAFAALAEEYRRLGRLDEAVATCRKGLQLRPTYHSARVTLARALSAGGHPQEAAAEFEQVLGSAPEHLVARRAFAELLQQLGDVPGALAHLRVAVQLAPQDPQLRDMLTATECAMRPAAHPADRTLEEPPASWAEPADAPQDQPVEAAMAGPVGADPEAERRRRQVAALEALLVGIARRRQGVEAPGGALG